MHEQTEWFKFLPERRPGVRSKHLPIFRMKISKMNAKKKPTSKSPERYNHAAGVPSREVVRDVMNNQ